MRSWQGVRQLVGQVRVRVLAGVVLVLVLAAVVVTFWANHTVSPATVDVLVAQTDLAAGTPLHTTTDVFTTVAVNADSPLLALFVSTASFASHADTVLLRKLSAGEPLPLSALGQAQPSGTVLTVLLARVAALDGAVSVGDRVRILTVDPTDPGGVAVDVVAVRSVSGGLGRQEQLALTVRVDTVEQAARLFAAAQQNSVLIVREGLSGE